MELERFKRTLRLAMALPIAACLFLAGVLLWQVYNTNETVQMAERYDQQIALTTRIEMLVVDDETGLRGYQATSDARFLEPYRAADAPMRQAIAQLQATTPNRIPGLDEFLEEHDTWHAAFAVPLIATIRAGGTTNDVDLNLTGKTSMDSMRRHLNIIIAAAEQHRSDSLAQWHRQRRDVWAIAIFLAVAIGLIIALFTRNRLESVSAAFLHSLDLERRRTQELFESEQNLRTTLASIGDGVITCGADGKVLMMNPIAQELTGWIESQAIDRPLEEVFSIVNETTRERVENPVAKVRRLNRIVGLGNHTMLIRNDGSEIAIDHSGSPIRNEAGEINGVVLVFRDVTMERRTRAALLANEKLVVAGRLAATIAHEIHNPLDSVANLLYLLRQRPVDEEAKHFLELAQSELARVTQISRAMLSLYRESKAPVPVVLKDMIDDLLLLMEGRFNTLGVRVRSDLPAEITIEGFPAELRQVFTNLITNAAEAAGSGGSVSVSVATQPARLRPSGERQPAGAVVTITDDGPGIADEVRDRLFEPFFTTKGERGTGLGLWVSQGIIRKHAGSIRLDSRTDSSCGTTASVFLASSPIMDPGGD